MTRARTWLVALVGVLLAGTAAAQQPPQPPQPPPPFTWEVPRTLGVVDVPGEVDINGVKVKLRAVRSAEKLDVIVQRLVDRFLLWGFLVPPQEKQVQLLREPMLTAVDTRRFISYTAIFQPNPDGTTTVFLGEANLGEAKPPRPAGVPVFPGGTNVLTAETEGTRTFSYAVSGKPAAEVEAFYRQELGKAGFREVEPRLFRSATEELQLTLSPVKGGPLSVVLLRRPAPPELDASH